MRIRRFTLGLSVAAILCAGSGLSAQAPAADPFSGIVRGGWNNIKRLVSASAAKMPDVEYGFKPTPDVRSFGQIIGHLINEHYGNLVTYLRLKGIVPPSSAGTP